MPDPVTACLTARLPQAISAQAWRGAALALLLAGLAGCAGNAPQFKPACPKTSVLADAADLTRFRTRGQDVTDIVLDGRITGVSGSCSLQDGTLLTEIAVSLEVSRGPAAQGRGTDFAYFIALADGATILDKRVVPVHMDFPANVERLRGTGQTFDMSLPVTREKSGAAYSVIVGFQLSPDELAFNRRRGPR